jgi:thiol-disulfide isomerase/thioredoxin
VARLSTGARWTIVGVVLVAALITVMLSQQRDQRLPGPRGQDPVAARERRDADTPAALAELRRQAQLPPCPTAGSGPGMPELAGITLECSGAGVPVGAVLAGRQVVLNLWAYWCGPCADELPAMAEVQRRAGDRLTVVTVHQDENEAAGLAKLAELHVRLPMIQDGARRIAAALKSPNVMPTTILIRADGSVARVLPRSFTSADEIGAEVEQALGVRF